MRYESTDWSIEVPEGWSHEDQQDCTTFTHPQGAGPQQFGCKPGLRFRITCK